MGRGDADRPRCRRACVYLASLMARSVEICRLGRGDRLMDRRPDRPRRPQHRRGPGGTGGQSQAGGRLQRVDQDPPVLHRIERLERFVEMTRGGRRVAVIEVETGQVDVPERDRRAGAARIACRDRLVGVPPGCPWPTKSAGDGGEAVAEAPLGRLVAELRKDGQGLLTFGHRHVKMAALPVGQIQGGQGMAACQRVARGDGDGERAGEERPSRIGQALVGQEGAEMDEGRPDLALDARLVEAGKGSLQVLARIVHVVGGGGDRPEAPQRPALAERIADRREPGTGLLAHLAPHREIGEPVGEVRATQGGLGAQGAERRRSSLEPPQPFEPLRRVAPQPVLGHGHRDVERTDGCLRLQRRGTGRQHRPDMRHLAVQELQRGRAIRRGQSPGQRGGSPDDRVQVVPARDRHQPGVAGLQGVDGDGAQELIAGRTVGAADLDEAGVNEAGDDVEDVEMRIGRVDDLGDEGRIGVRDHHGEGHHDPPLKRAKAGHARIQGRPEARPAARRPAGPTTQVDLDAFGQLVEAEQVEVARHELQAQGQAVNEPAEAVGRGQLVGPQLEVRVHQLGPVDQELKSFRLGQRPDRDERLVDEPEPLAARGEDADPGACRHDRVDLRGGVGRPRLTAIEHEQPGRVRELLDHALTRIGRQRGRSHDVEDRCRHRLLQGHLIEGDVPHGRRRVPGGLDRQARLPRPGRADQGHDPSPRPDLRKGILLPGPPDEAGRGAGQARAMLRGRPMSERRVQGRVLGQDGLLHPPQAGPRLDAQVVHEAPATFGIDIERFRLAAGPVEGQHEQLPAPLAIGLLGGQTASHRHGIGVAAEVELEGQEVFPQPGHELLDAGRLDLPGEDRLQVGRQAATPQVERLAEEAGRPPRIIRLDPPRLGRQAVQLAPGRSGRPGRSRRRSCRWPGPGAAAARRRRRACGGPWAAARRPRGPSPARRTRRVAPAAMPSRATRRRCIGPPAATSVPTVADPQRP